MWPPGVDAGQFTPGDRGRRAQGSGSSRGAFVAVCARRLVSTDGDRRPARRLGADRGHAARRARAAARRRRARCATSSPSAPARPPLAGRVRVLGRVSDDELVDAYRAADVAVVPTLAFEGFGLVVLEAAACGTPSIVSDVGGLPEAAAALDRSLIVAPRRRRGARRAARAGRSGSAAEPRERPAATPRASPGRPLAERHRAPLPGASPRGERRRAPAGRLPRPRRPPLRRRDRAAAPAAAPGARERPRDPGRGRAARRAAWLRPGSRSRCCRSPPPRGTCARTVSRPGGGSPAGALGDAGLRRAPAQPPAPACSPTWCTPTR